MGTEGCFAGSTAACVRCKADHSSPSHIHPKNGCSCTSAPHIASGRTKGQLYCLCNLNLSCHCLNFDFVGSQCQATSLPSILMILSLYHSVFFTHISLHSFENIRFHTARSPTRETSSCLDSG